MHTYKSSLQFLYSRCTYLWTREKKEFLMSSAILVLVYRQALIWTGTLACPVLPLVGSMSVLLFFAVNYSTVVTSCKPPENRWNQSRHSTLFIGLLTVTLLILLVPVAVIIGSKDVVNIGQTNVAGRSCGPFGLHSPIGTLTSLQSRLPEWLADMFHWLSSATVLLPAGFVLL
ncbi:transmembrane channel-like protein 1 [Lingula anatina]|uniref:Transmembrane channel-like protein 1 n=1 Tax=Lingula anatina TaxID=7574 RepID=A0A1S3J7G1_LINAN|nr:transmembrane channel-like protein 1 [Lingula anatina]|eukprot:XP_013406248.1 transmembrane channel-like protein 1 [Lingula anatina]